jgi:acyl-coenzyme A thioesterase PaaI-like protein
MITIFWLDNLSEHGSSVLLPKVRKERCNQPKIAHCPFGYFHHLQSTSKKTSIAQNTLNLHFTHFNMVFHGSRPLVARGSQFLPRSFGSLGGGRKPDSRFNKSRSNAQQMRHQGSTSSRTGASASSGWWTSPLVLPAATAAIIGGSLSLAYNKYVLQKDVSITGLSDDQIAIKNNSTWAAKISREPGVVKVLDAETLLAQDHPFLEDDHMFSAFVQRGIIKDINGYYNAKVNKFLAVVALGREVAGFPKVVHGGLTAAIFDEAFGGLLFSLKKDGNVATSWGPAYTVALEVAYKHKIPAGATVLCSAELESLEGRKMWFKATMTDGPEGKVYATARALFVSPKPHKMVWDVVKYVGRRANEALPWTPTN